MIFHNDPMIATTNATKIRGVCFEANINAVSADIIDNGDLNGGDEGGLSKKMSHTLYCLLKY
jgi:hypothetical protein